MVVDERLVLTESLGHPNPAQWSPVGGGGGGGVRERQRRSQRGTVQ